MPLRIEETFCKWNWSNGHCPSTSDDWSSNSHTSSDGLLMIVPPFSSLITSPPEAIVLTLQAQFDRTGDEFTRKFP
ncbi:hypothetical protein TNIN_427101 [Trichonephila inaurata madagascariensis]|uniref:Uncharacterized protein n=1 Tax=Trichonephila inaurata madagascariensis TaxID=2747483 RepID=A0A8X7C1J5_9ARAC|nr:hypothetical protein TNIN_427101 [Trichonephila inaurata madagascariensis]